MKLDMEHRRLFASRFLGFSTRYLSAPSQTIKRTISDEFFQRN